MKDFADKVVFVTGGSSGIGLAACRVFAQKGAHLALFARDEKRLQCAASGISECRAKQGRVCFFPLDVADREAVQARMEQAVSEMGAPDVLFNCAGRALPMPFEDVAFEQFDATMKINLYGTWNTVAALAPLMKQRGSGLIVNTSSVAGLVGVFGYTDYCASKFAVIGFSEALRGELSPHGVRVQVLCPPDTDTPGFEAENKTKPQETKAISANAKLLSADDVALGLVKGIAGGQFLIIPGFDGKLTWLAKRLFPGLVSAVMDRAVSKARKVESHGPGA